MAPFACDSCGAVREGRCRPEKCPKCGKSGKDQFVKKQVMKINKTGYHRRDEELKNS